MRIETLMEEQRAATGFTHRFTVDYTDLTSFAALTATLQLLNDLTARHLVSKAAFELETAFAGTSITNLALDVGYDLASGTDDPDAFLDAYELCGAATEILAGDGNGVVFATLRTGYANQEEMDIEVLFTAVGANLSALTAGRVHIYLAVNDLKALR
jgi:hypothetical protein